MAMGRSAVVTTRESTSNGFSSALPQAALKRSRVKERAPRVKNERVLSTARITVS